MKFKRLFQIFIISVSLAVILYLIYSHFTASSSKPIPVIEAEKADTRIKPTDAGGIIIPNSDNAIYENMGKESIHKKINLLPEPEQALPLAAQKTIDHELVSSIDEMLASITTATDIYDKDDSSAAGSIFNEETIISIDSKFIDEETSIDYEIPVKTLNIVKVTNQSKKIDKIGNYNPSQKGRYKIQLASMKSESLAIIEGERIKKKHQKILGNLNFTHKKIQQEKDKFFYIVLAGDYSNLSQAKAACKKLSTRQQSCMIYQP